MENKLPLVDYQHAINWFCDRHCNELSLNAHVSWSESHVVGFGRSRDFDVVLGNHDVFLDFGFGDVNGDCLDDRAATRMAVAVGHELSHIYQAVEFRSNANEDIFAALNMLAHANNMTHYCSYYKSDMLELMAERDGIAVARDVLLSTGKFTEDDCDRMLVDYVNERKGILGYGNRKFGNIAFNGASYPIYGSPFSKFNDMDEVMAEFDYCIERCAMIEKPYPEDTLKWSDDEFLRVVGRDRGKKELKGWDGVFEKFQNEHDGFMQAKMMACVSCHVHPERQAMFASLKDCDLSPESVFGEPFPETQSEVRIRLGIEKAKGLSGLLQSVKPKERKMPDDVRTKMYECSMLGSIPIRAFDGRGSDDMDFGG